MAAPRLDVLLFSSTNKGKNLLDTLSQRRTPLTNQEVDAIVHYIEHDTTQTVQQAGSNALYQSTDLHIGQSRLNGNFAQDGNAAVEQFDPAIQEMAFSFVKSDLRIEQRLRRTHNWIRIRGISRPFYHHQLYAAFWLLSQERGIRRGAIEADLMGLGKTTIAYLYIVLNFLLSENARDVLEHPERHCSASVSGGYQQPPDIECPSAHDWPIPCACEESSITHRLTPRDGGSLVIVPAGLIGSWDSQWTELGLDDQILPLKTYIHHRDYQNRLAPSSVLSQLALVPLTGEGPDTIMHLPNPKLAHRSIIITSIESYNQWVQVYCQRLRKWTYTPSDVEKPDDYTDGLAWGRVLKDEAHLTTNYCTSLFRILESLASSGWTPPNFVALTGTPMLRKGVADIIAFIKVINMLSPALASHPEYAEFTDSDYLNQLIQRSHQTQRLKPTRRAVNYSTDHELVQIVGRLLSQYCIRRRSTSFQNGKVLALLPPLTCYDVSCYTTSEQAIQQVRRVDHILKKKLNKAWSHQLQKWQAYGRDPAEFECDLELLLDNACLNRILATIPALARYGSKKDLTWDRVQANGWHINTEASLFYQVIGELEESSGKLQALRWFFDQWSPSQAWDGLPEKLVIISEFAMVCHIVACFCHRLGISYRWMHADVKPIDRRELVDDFQAARGNFRVLIGSAPIIGQGWTLHRAHRLILMEPSHHAAVEEQNAERVHRLGSKTDRCWFYRLVNRDSAFEKILAAHQNDQRRLSRMAEWFHLLPDDDVK